MLDCTHRWIGNVCTNCGVGHHIAQEQQVKSLKRQLETANQFIVKQRCGVTETPLTDSATVPLTLTHAATLERRGQAWAKCAADYEALFTGQPTAVDVDKVREEFKRLSALKLWEAPL